MAAVRRRYQLSRGVGTPTANSFVRRVARQGFRNGAIDARLRGRRAIRGSRDGLAAEAIENLCDFCVAPKMGLAVGGLILPAAHGKAVPAAIKDGIAERPDASRISRPPGLREKRRPT